MNPAPHFQRESVGDLGANECLGAAPVQPALGVMNPLHTLRPFPSLAAHHSRSTERLCSFISDHQHSRSSVFTSVGGGPLGAIVSVVREKLCNGVGWGAPIVCSEEGVGVWGGWYQS